MRRTLLIGAAAVALSATVARADARVAPSVTASGGTQRGAVVYTDVARPTGKNMCVDQHTDAVGYFPDPIGHDGSALSWTVGGATRPARVTVLLWRAGTDTAGLGQAETVPVTAKRILTHGRTTGWTYTSAAVGYGDLHLDLTVYWPKAACGADEGRYRYHLLAVPRV